jgi:hypothetical protein
VLGDPEFQWAKFWKQPCNLLESIANGITEDEEQRANQQSITTAKLIDSIHSIAHALYGKEGSKFESSLIDSLPFPERLRPKEELEGVITPTKETIEIFLELSRQGRIPGAVFAHLQPLIAIWTK